MDECGKDTLRIGDVAIDTNDSIWSHYDVMALRRYPGIYTVGLYVFFEIILNL